LALGGRLTIDGDSDEGLAHLDGLLYHEAHIINAVGAKVHGPTSAVDKDTNWEFLLLAALGHSGSGDVQSQTVLAEGRGTLIRAVLHNVSEASHEHERETHPVANTRVSILGDLLDLESLVQRLRVLKTKLADRRLSKGNTEEEILI
jgi:hypothetical protein